MDEQNENEFRGATPEKLGKALMRSRKQRPLKVIAGAPDKPLSIGDIEIPCYVLEGEIRVLVQSQLQMSVGMSRSGGTGGAHRLAIFFEKLSEKDDKISDLALRIAAHIRSPIEFVLPGVIAYGYPATLIVDICDAVLEARRLGILLTNQIHIAERCEILVRGFSRIGIDALVDEVTGYQDMRSKKALAEILERYLGELEVHPWIKTFPLQFYKEIYRLKGWKWIGQPDGKKPPTHRVVGRFTNELIYDRLVPEFPRAVRDELDKVNPITKGGWRKYKNHQWFTEDEGLPLLRAHIDRITGIMMGLDGWDEFFRKVKERFPRTGDQKEFDLPVKKK